LVLLIAVHRSGATETYSLTRPSESTSWVIEKEAVKTHTVEDPLPGGSFVVDRKSGDKRIADRAMLETCLQSSTAVAGLPSVLIVSGTKKVKCFADITGERVGKAEWDSKCGTVSCVEIIERMGKLLIDKYFV
jgi:syntaxin-binding protein 5